MANNLPPSIFSNAYNTVRDAHLSAKMKRKQHLRTQAIINPEKHAAMKLQRNVKKREAKKRKNRAHAVNNTPIKVAKTSLDETPGKKVFR